MRSFFSRVRAPRWKWVLAACLLFSALLLCIALLPAREAALPVLMYHHIGDETTSDMVVSPAHFEEQMAALTEGGWHSVTMEQLIGFVEDGTPLPSKSVLITFDDGYTSNLELAAPILEQYGQHGVIFVIGINAGQKYYVHSGTPLTPARFALTDALPYLELGVLELQSHTYDLHQLASYEISGRDGVLPLSGESEADYTDILTRDIQLQQALFVRELDCGITALAYPFGFSCPEAEDIFTQAGIQVTFTTEPGNNTLVRGQPESLLQLNRYTVTDRMAAEDLLWLLDQP